LEKPSNRRNSRSAGAVPRYRVIERDLCDLITSGRLSVGQKLPTEMELSRRYSVSRLTTRKALDNLRERGFIERFQGRGTFVSSRAGTGNALTLNRNLAFLLIDSTLQTSLWNVQIVKSAAQAAERHGYNLTFCTTRTADLLEGKVPLAIRQGSASGLLVDGQVTTITLKALDGLELPYVLIGGHPQSARSCSVAPDNAQACYEITRRLLELDNGPVWLLVEPFTMHFTIQLHQGYQQAVQPRPGAAELIETLPEDCPRGAVQAVANKILARTDRRFCIVCQKHFVPGLIDAFKQHRLELDGLPIVMLGLREPWWSYDQHVLLCEYPVEAIAGAAVDVMVANLQEQPAVRNVRFKLTVADQGAAWPFAYRWYREGPHPAQATAPAPTGTLKQGPLTAIMPAR